MSFDKITEKNCPRGITFERYDDHTVLRRQITYDLHIPKVRECIIINLELLVKLFFTGFSGPLLKAAL